MAQSLSLSKVVKSQAGWYRGDFHAHTNVSLDGHYSPAQLAEMAKTEGLDFLAITDHNTIGAFTEFEEEPAVLIIPGVEVTLTHGHFNVFGVERWYGWMDHICAGENTVQLKGKYGVATEVMRQASARGLLSSINHPLLEPWEWRDAATDLRYVDCLEIWNNPAYPPNVDANPEAVALWTALLNAGYRITAIGGSDYHRPVLLPEEEKLIEHVGVPSTYVYAEELSGAAILAGLRRRQAYVGMGARVTFQARANSRTYEIGADLGIPGSTIEFAATVSESPVSARAQIVKNGRVVAEAPVEDGQASLGYSDSADPARSDWYRFDVLDQDGLMLAITNPVFVGRRRSPDLHTYGDFVNLKPFGSARI